MAGSSTVVANATPQSAIDEALAAERDGFAFLSLPNIFGLDAITVCAIVGMATERIELTTGVVPTPNRHPTVMAQQALTAHAACGGRFSLGIGLSHKLVVEDLFGLSYARPAQQMREYLDVLMPLMRGEAAKANGDLYRVNVGLNVATPSDVPVLIAALGPKMLAIAGASAAGTATWMTGPRTLAEHIIPRIRAAAEEAGRPAPRIVASLPIALASDPVASKSKASETFAIYGGLPSYRAMLDREGAAQPGDIAITGDESELRRALDEMRDSGVTDFAASLYEAEPGSSERTREFLKSLL